MCVQQNEKSHKFKRQDLSNCVKRILRRFFYQK